MARIWKRIIVAALLLITVGAAALALFLSTLNISDYRSRIEHRLSERIGRQVQLLGQMELEISLWPRFVVEDVRVANTPWAETDSLASAKRIEVQVELLDLLRRHIKITELNIRGGTINLERKADGTPNWLLRSRTPKFTKELVALDIRDATVRYFDAGKLQGDARITHLEAALGEKDPLRVDLQGTYRRMPVRIEIAGASMGALTRADAPWPLIAEAKVGNAQFSAHARLLDGLELRRYEAELSGKGKGLGSFRLLAKQPLPVLGSFSLHVTVAKTPNRLNMAVSAKGANVDLGPMLRSAPQSFRLREISFDVAGTGTDLKGWVRGSRWHVVGKDARFQQAGVPVAVERATASAEPGAPLTFELYGALNNAPLELNGSAGPLERLLLMPRSSPVSLKLQLAKISARLNGSFYRHVFEGRVVLTGRSLQRAGKLINRHWPLIGPYRLSGNIHYKAGTLKSSDLVMELGKSRVGGNATISRGQTIKADLSITSGDVELQDVKQLVGSSNQKSRAKSRQIRQRLIPEFSLSRITPRRVDIELNLKNFRFRRGSAVVAQWEGRLRADKGRATLFSLIGRVSGATVSTHFKLDTRPTPDEVSMSLDMGSVDYGKLLELLGVTDRVSGKLDMSLQLEGRGDTLHSLLASADGTLELVGGGGSMPRTLLELWGGSVLQVFNPVRWAEGDTVKINCGVGRLSVDDGIVSSDVLLLDTTRITVAGELGVNLGTEQVSGLFQSKPKRAVLFRLGSPVRISGTLAHPKAELTESKWVTFGKLLIGLTHPNAIIVLFGDLGSGEKNPCKTLLQKVSDTDGASSHAK